MIIKIIILFYIILTYSNLLPVLCGEENTITGYLADFYLDSLNSLGKLLVLILYIIVLPAVIASILIALPICIVKCGWMKAGEAFKTIGYLTGKEEYVFYRNYKEEEMKMNRITINGTTIECSGRNVVVNNDSVVVDGKVIKQGITGDIRVIIDGNVESVNCNGSVEVKGNSGMIDCGGSCTVNGDVNGSIDCGGSCHCGKVSGNVDAGGSVHCR